MIKAVLSCATLKFMLEDKIFGWVVDNSFALNLILLSDEEMLARTPTNIHTYTNIVECGYA